MSQAPTLRKSRKALVSAKDAAAAASEEKPRPHQVILRVKRKRGDTAVDSLFVVATGDDEPDRKRRLAAGSIAENLAVLTLEKDRDNRPDQQELIQAPACLCYMRSRPTDRDVSFLDEEHESRGTNPPPEEIKAVESSGTDGGGGRLDALLRDKSKATMAPTAAVVDYLEVQRLRAKAKVAGAAVSKVDRGSERSEPSSPGVASSAADFHVIDLQPVGISKTSLGISGVDGGAGRHRSERSIDSPAAAPVLNPLERQLDEAIFTAFRTGNLSTLRDTVSSSPALVNYRRRIGDGTTALMAAAFFGDMDTVRYFLSLGAEASLVDISGKTAAVLAGMRGHRECFAELQRVADKETVRENRVGGGRDFVYDLYYFSPTESRVNSLERGSGSVDQTGVEMPWLVNVGEKTQASTTAPVVHLSGIGPIDENAADTMGLELTFEHDSEWSELRDEDLGDDPDSNSEGYYVNDYPEEEDGDDGSGSPYLNQDSPSVENGSYSDSTSSSDEEPYSRRIMHSFEFDGLTRSAFRSSPLASSPELETGRYLQQQTSASADVDVMDGFAPPELGMAQVLAWERSS